MPWSERQARMLDAMGLQVWQPASEAPARAAAPSVPAATTTPPAAAATGALSPSRSPAAEPAPRASTAHALLPRPLPAVAALDWPALRQAVADCRACSLCDSRSQTVFGVGDERAQWLVVGEAPGEQEDATGEPFVGPAGQLLDRMLRALQLTRRTDDAAVPAAQRVYITNTLKCRPPRNRNPAPDELALCRPYLERQIELLRPRIVLAMGRFAVQALLGSDEAIGKLRGRVHASPHAPGVPVIVSFHPSYLLRSPLEKAKAWEDLCLAAATFDATPPQPQP